MKKNMNSEDTICAISTPSGVGGIAVIRISGEDAIEICDKIFVAKNKKKIAETPANTVIFGQIFNITRHCGKSRNLNDEEIAGQARNDNVVVDEVLVSIFRAPHSFTGEDVVEISCHGSTFIQQEILKLLLEKGCRLARAGEFTQRAFLNGKMDLSQAEAVADLIASQSAAAHAMAVNQMRGGFSNELKTLRSQLLDFVSLIELELDFSEEDLEFADREKLQVLAKTITEKISILAKSFQLGNAIKNGIPVAIVGETNVGKSTLLNVLLNEEKAIVSNIHGTTRDVIEDIVNIKGIIFRFIDTAGIRQSSDSIENLGIERSYQQIDKAQIVLCLIDGDTSIPNEIINRAKDKKIIIVINKIDLYSEEKLRQLRQQFTDFDYEIIEISAKNKINTEKLQEALMNAAHHRHCGESRNPLSNEIAGQARNDGYPSVIISNVRHYEALKNALSAMERVIAGLARNISGDFLSQDIREAMHYLGEITGEITNDELLGNIFGRFCIGK
jgi:tRNA modification GTPase